MKPPKHWKEQWEGILKMREKRDADVDYYGTEMLPDRSQTISVFRYQALVSVMLSSQTKDPVTAACVQRLRKHGFTIENILATSEDDLKQLIYGVGFHNRKTQYILQTSKILRDQYDGMVPNDLEALCSMPGIGQKMAKIALHVAYGDPQGISVDTHVHRIANRMGWVRATKTPEKTSEELESWMPRDVWNDVNLILVGFGQQICLPRTPRCEQCSIASICPKIGTKSRAMK